jgi:hypothetical protein
MEGGVNLKNDPTVFGRTLMYITEDGYRSLFTVSITVPEKISPHEFKCSIFSQNIIFKGKKSSVGVDEIDAIDFAIKKMDKIISLSGMDLYWPDGSKYVRYLQEWQAE